MSTSTDPSPEAIEQTLRSTLTPRAHLTAADRARRSSLLRTEGAGWIGGVCAAIAAALGVSVLLVRLTAVVLAGTGAGLVLYPVLMLLLPRTARTRARAEAPEAAVDDAEMAEIPLGAMARGRVRTVDVLVVLSLIPAMLVGGYLLLLLVIYGKALLVLLLLLSVLLLAVLALAAGRASQARQAMMLAVLARRAGFKDQVELEEFLAEQHRRAPYAWGERPVADPVPVDTAAAVPGRARRGRGRGDRTGRNRPRVQKPSARTTLAVLALTLAAGALTFLTVNLTPQLLPAVTQDPPLPQIGRATAALAVMTTVTGAALVVIGWRGKRSVTIALVGLLALGGTSLGAGWLRLTHSPGAEPLVIAMSEDLTAGDAFCPTDLGSAGVDMVLDLSAVTAPQPGQDHDDESGESTMPEERAYAACERPFGDVTVILPKDPSLVELHAHSDLGEVHGQPSVTGGVDAPLVVHAYTGLGDIRIQPYPGTPAQEETP